jgi:hypothetical protein
MPKLEEYKRHRLDRERQVLRALAEGPSDSAELTRRVYERELSGEQLFRAAEMTLQAHLRKLVDEGRVRSEGSLFSLL